MKLFLLRHGEAEDDAPGGKDADRRLTENGRRATRSVASALTGVAKVSRILASPLLRARETAEIVAKAFPRAPLAITKALSPSATVEEILVELESPGEEEGILLVGHQPHLGLLLGYLVTGKAGAEIPVRKSSVSCVAFKSGRPEPPGALRWMLSPRIAERIR